jgi:hypothetical protein
VKGFATHSAFPHVGRDLIPITSDPPEEAATMTSSEHPDFETLERFVLGRLDRRTMARVEGHLTGCSECGQVAMQVADDRLVSLLRVSIVGPATESSHCNAASSPCPRLEEPLRMCSTKRSPRSRITLVLLACLVGVLGFSIPGCSTGGGDATLSPEAKARAKETFKKKFQGFGETKAPKKSR